MECSPLVNTNVYVDGVGYAGRVKSGSPPDLALVTEDYRAGGRDLPEKIPLGMEPLDASFELYSYDADLLRLFGWRDGGPISVVFRGVTQSASGSVNAIKITMSGRIVSVRRGNWEPGQSATTAFEVNATYYKEEVAGSVVIEIDGPNMKRIVGGVDQLEKHRSALGI